MTMCKIKPIPTPPMGVDFQKGPISMLLEDHKKIQGTAKGHLNIYNYIYIMEGQMAILLFLCSRRCRGVWPSFTLNCTRHKC